MQVLPLMLCSVFGGSTFAVSEGGFFVNAFVSLL